MDNDDQNAENAARKVGMVPELGMGYGGWRTAPPYTEEVGKAAEKYCSSFTFAVRTPATWRWQELYDLMVAAAQGAADDEPIETNTGNSVTYDLPSFQYVERPPMTLSEIVAAVRTNELVTGRDMRYAIVAFDVLMSQLRIDQHVEQLQEYFKAATAVPREYAGHMNDPENPEAVEWYKAMQEVSGS